MALTDLSARADESNHLIRRPLIMTITIRDQTEQVGMAVMLCASIQEMIGLILGRHSS
jgi:hypothetical protein